MPLVPATLITGIANFSPRRSISVFVRDSVAPLDEVASEIKVLRKDLESRPMERLLRDVADLVKPSDSKAQIVAYAIAMKFRRAEAQERAKILESLEATIRWLQPGEQRERVNAIVDRLRNHES